MNYLSVEGLSHSFGPQTLFEKLNFGVDRGDRAALIAENGAGKSTLMKILAGEMEADEGRCVFRQNLRTAYLPQEPLFPPEKSVWECLIDSAGLRPADPEEAQARETLGKKALERVKLPDPRQKAGTLSSGQRKRLALAAVVTDEPDLLFLDEVTNHLDMESIEWLEGFLAKSPFAVLAITHDRYFLDRVCNKIFELENQKLYTHFGTYADYLENKTEREENERNSQKKSLNRYRRELEWMRRQPKARGTKSKGRIKTAEEFGQKSRIKKEENLKFLEINSERLGGKVLNLYGLGKSYGENKIIDDFTYFFRKEDRIGIVGKNGVGKTTFLKVIQGLIPADSGKVVRGETFKVGCFGQENEDLDGSLRIVESVREVADFIPLAKGKNLTAEQLLERFLFPRSEQRKFVEKLSGGEKRRLKLLKVLMKNPNFLILDEPTNDLDLISLSVLEEFLGEFPGCLLTVSHDRYFLERVCNRLFVFEGQGKISEYHGTFEEYKIWKAETANLPETPAETPEKRNKINYRIRSAQQKELKKLEKEIKSLEDNRNQLEAKLNGGETDYARLGELSDQLNALLSELETKENRWLELSEELET